MTTRKITAFLMCPAANGDASGGTPAASAASGGHIKKGAWVTAHDAALVGLAQVIPGPLSRALPYCYENKADECVDGKEGPEEVGVHRSVLALVAPLLIHGALQAGVSDGDEKEQHTDASHQGADDAQQVDEEVAHGQTPTGGTFATARICFILWRWRYEGYGLTGFMSGLGFLLGAQALQLAVACLREHNQLLPECESRFGGCTFQKVADGCLAASADRGDLHLAKTALLNA